MRNFTVISNCIAQHCWRAIVAARGLLKYRRICAKYQQTISLSGILITLSLLVQVYESVWMCISVGCIHIVFGCLIVPHMRTSCKPPSQRTIWFRMCETKATYDSLMNWHWVCRFEYVYLGIYLDVWMCMCLPFFLLHNIFTTNIWNYEHNLNIDCFPGHKINNNIPNAPSNGQQTTTMHTSPIRCIDTSNSA